MLYRVLKLVFSYALRKYFSEIRVMQSELLPLKGPAILFCNHRSAFMDPIVVAALINRPVYFLARGESFKSPVLAWLFKQFHMIPIYRKEFNPGESHKNEEVFDRCVSILEEGGAIMIFPEGLSQTKPRLLPFKTGAARIAFRAEEINQFKLGVKMVPIGINYSNPHRFQSRLLLNFGESIEVNQYYQVFESNREEAIKSLTTDMEKSLRERIITLDGKRWFNLSEKIEAIVKTEPEKYSDQTDRFDWFVARKDIHEGIAYFKKERPQVLEELENRVQKYFLMIERLRLSKESVRTKLENQPLRYNLPLMLTGLTLGFPIFLAGTLLLGVPFLLTRFLSLKIVKRTDFMGSVVLALGLLIFSVFGFVEAYVAYKMIGHWLVPISVILLLPLLGLYTRRYYLEMTHFNQNSRWLFLGNKKNRLADQVIREKTELLELISQVLQKDKEGLQSLNDLGNAEGNSNKSTPLP